MTQACFGAENVDGTVDEESERGGRFDDCRSTSIAGRGGNVGRSLGIEKLWDMLDPVATIF